MTPLGSTPRGSPGSPERDHRDHGSCPGGGADGTRKLWQITYDYLTKTRGFDNIIWVWDMLSKQPRWAFFMLWPDFIDENESVLPALYNAPNVITEDEMPGWE